MCGRLVNLDTVARVLAEYYHLKTETQLAALDEALSKVPTETVGDSHKKDHVADPGNMVGDSISRAAAIKAIKEDKIDLTDPNVVAVFKATGDFEKAETQSMTCDRHIKILKDLPSAQQERKKGKWIYHPEIGWGDTWLCDQCGEKTTSTVMGKPRANYCPMCGADVRGKQDG